MSPSRRNDPPRHRRCECDHTESSHLTEETMVEVKTGRDLIAVIGCLFCDCARYEPRDTEALRSFSYRGPTA